MEHALNLLDHQPTAWPKWEVGTDADNLPTREQHMFIFDPAEYGNGFGRAVAACQFVGGAHYVRRLNGFAPPMPGPRRDMCQDCMEVSLQHGIRAVC